MVLMTEIVLALEDGPGATGTWPKLAHPFGFWPGSDLELDIRRRRPP